MASLITRLALIIVATATWLGLAVVGWGGLRPFFAHDALAALTVVVCVVAAASVFAGGNVGSGVREDHRARTARLIPGIY